LKGVRGGGKKFVKKGGNAPAASGGRITFMVNLWKNHVPFINEYNNNGNDSSDNSTGDFSETNFSGPLEIEDKMTSERDVNIEAEPIMMHFVSSGATWGGDDDEETEIEDDEDEDENEPPSGLMLFMLRPLPKITKRNATSIRIRYNVEDIMPRLVMCDDEEEEVEFDDEEEEVKFDDEDEEVLEEGMDNM